MAVGVVLALDALLTWLILLVWMGRGHVPDFLEPTVYGALGVLLVALKSLGGVVGATQLFRLRHSGRVIAAVVAGYNASFVLVAAIRGGALTAIAWGTFALNAAMLVVVLLPAAGAACDAAVGPALRGGGATGRTAR